MLKERGNEHEKPVGVGVDIVEVDGQIVVVAIYGASADMKKYFGDIILSQESYKRAR